MCTLRHTQWTAQPQPRHSRGISLVELMVGILILSAATLALYGGCAARRSASRMAEAANMLNKMWAGSLVYYETDHLRADGTELPRQFPGPRAAWESETECGCQPNHACPGGSPMWSSDPVWRALRFNLPDPHRYMPGYTSKGTKADASFRAYAKGDLDCNGKLAEFWRDGSINSSGEVMGSFQPVSRNELE